MLCHDRISSALFYNIHHIFCSTKMWFQLWDALEENYVFEELGFKRYSVEKLLDFHMVEGKSISNQIYDFENVFFLI